MKLYFILISGSLKSRMQYKMNFIFSMVSYGMIMAVDFILLAAILRRFDDVKGWDLYEVGLLYSISSISISLYRVIGAEVHDFERYMVNGEFDSLLIRPVSPLFLLMTRNIDLSRIGGAIQGIIIMAVSVAGLMKSGKATILLITYLPAAVMAGLVICFAVGVLTAALAFWTEKIKDFQTFTLYAPFTAANYPMNIYPGMLKIVFFTVIPVAFMNYVPVMYLLQKGGEWWYLITPAAVAGIFLTFSLAMWQIGIRHYHSTGS
jgi:ABC-2 type transport system permease protein